MFILAKVEFDRLPPNPWCRYYKKRCKILKIQAAHACYNGRTTQNAMEVIMKSTQAYNAQSVLLTEDHIYFGGMSLSYQLLVKSDYPIHHFYIRIQKSEEEEMAEVGTDLYHAVRCYQSIVRGAVTPCTLVEVVSDLRYA